MMVGGSVTVDASGNATGTGLAKALYDAEIATLGLPSPPTPGDTSAPYTELRPAVADDVTAHEAGTLAAKRSVAQRATAWAPAIVTYLQANAVAVIPATTAGDGLQSGTTHPASQKTLAIQ